MLEQHLLLRGRREFESSEVFENFIQQVMEKRNQRRQEKLVQEIAIMKPIKASALALCRREEVSVSKYSLIQVLNKTYSVPTRLKNKTVVVEIYQ